MQQTSDIAVPPARDPVDARERPVLTYCDDATGERVELTAAELGSWAARTAALLRDGCHLGSGARVAVLLPPHWQTAAVLLGAWSAGIAVAFHPWATAGLAPAGTDVDDLDAVFVSRARLDSWLETVPAARHRFVLGLTPSDGHAGAAAGGAPAGTPPGYRDYLAEVARYPDAPPKYGSIGPDDAASPDGTSYREWAVVAQGIAERRGLRAGDRVLVDVATTEQPVAWLLAPLVAGASVVLCANLDPATRDARIRDERVSRAL